MIAFSSRLNHAIRVATRAHEGQFRKGSDTPYIAHPMAVAMITQQYLEDEDLFIAALFHDILEDVPKWTYSREDIRDSFGQQVLEIVEDVSEPDINFPALSAWTERKNYYIEHISKTENVRSILVSIADKIHNMSEILREYNEKGDDVWQNFHVDKGREIWFFEEVFNAIKNKPNVPAVAIAEYDRILDELKKLDDRSYH